MTEGTKDTLAVMNGFGKERYGDKVKERVKRDLKLHPEDEIAVLRKAVALLFEIVSKLHSEEINNSEFLEYHALVETIKSEHVDLKSEDTQK